MVFVRKPPTFVPQHGMNQQTPASQHLISYAVGPVRLSATGGKKKARRVKRARAAATARSAKGRRTSSRTKSKRAHLVKGSKAAKAYMAKIRKKRG